MFFEWIEALEAELNRSSTIPNLKEVKALMTRSMSLDLQARIMDGCIRHGLYDPTLVEWFDMLVKYCYTRYERVRAFSRIKKARKGPNKWAQQFCTAMNKLRYSYKLGDLQQVRDKLPGTLRNSLWLEFQMANSSRVFGYYLDQLIKDDSIEPIHPEIYRVPTANAPQVMPKYPPPPHERGENCRCEKYESIDQGVGNRCFQCRFERFVWKRFRQNVIEGMPMTCFWQNPKVARPGYHMTATFVRVEHNSVIVLQDAYSLLSAFFYVPYDWLHPVDANLFWSKIMFAARTVMGTLPQILTIARVRVTSVPELISLARKEQIDVRFVRETWNHKTMAVFFQMALETSIDRMERKIYILKSFQEDYNHYGFLDGGVSPHERHFGVKAPRMLQHAEHRKYEKYITIPEDIIPYEEMTFPAALSMFYPLKDKLLYLTFFSKGYCNVDPQIHKELRLAVEKNGVLEPNFKVNDLVLFSYMDTQVWLNETNNNPDLLYRNMRKSTTPLFATRKDPNPTSRITSMTSIATRIYKKNTRHPKPPFLAPFKVLAVTEVPNTGKRVYKIESTGPRKFVFDGVENACLRRCYTNIKLRYYSDHSKFEDAARIVKATSVEE